MFLQKNFVSTKYTMFFITRVISIIFNRKTLETFSRLISTLAPTLNHLINYQTSKNTTETAKQFNNTTTKLHF